MLTSKSAYAILQYTEKMKKYDAETEKGERWMTYRALFEMLRKYWSLTVGLTFLGALFAYFITLWCVHPVYTASVMLCVRNRESYEGGISSADIAASEALAGSCAQVLAGGDMMESVSSELSGISASELVLHLRFTYREAGVLTLSVSDADRIRAQHAAQLLAEAAVSVVPEKINAGAITIIDSVSVSDGSRPLVSNTVIGTVAGLFAGFVLSILIGERKKHREN